MLDLKDSNLLLTATTMSGLEELLGRELLNLGAREVTPLKRAVSFKGDLGFIYKANFCLRTAIRILVPVKTFEVQNEDQLYEGIKAMQWEELMDPSKTLAIDSSVNSPHFNHTLYVAQKSKDAITDRFRERTGGRPSVDLADPDLRINIHISGTSCIVSIDSSGESLHKRGYRREINIAPLNEVLAAGMVLHSGWDKRTNFIDPMCGSGTLSTEAAMYSANIPPGFFRTGGIEKQKEAFAFMRWKDHDKELWQKIFEGSVSKINNNAPLITASDVSESVLKKAKKNFQAAKVDDMIRSKYIAFQKLEKPEGTGTIILNPPYGERMDKDDILKLYKEIGDTLKKNWSGYTAWILTANMEAVNEIGLRATRRIALFNGSLECKFLKFDLYSGSKKIK